MLENPNNNNNNQKQEKGQFSDNQKLAYALVIGSGNIKEDAEIFASNGGLGAIHKEINNVIIEIFNKKIQEEKWITAFEKKKFSTLVVTDFLDDVVNDALYDLSLKGLQSAEVKNYVDGIVNKNAKTKQDLLNIKAMGFDTFVQALDAVSDPKKSNGSILDPEIHFYPSFRKKVLEDCAAAVKANDKEIAEYSKEKEANPSLKEPKRLTYKEISQLSNDLHSNCFASYYIILEYMPRLENKATRDEVLKWLDSLMDAANNVDIGELISTLTSDEKSAVGKITSTIWQLGSNLPSLITTVAKEGWSLSKGKLSVQTQGLKYSSKKDELITEIASIVKALLINPKAWPELAAKRDKLEKLLNQPKNAKNLATKIITVVDRKFNQKSKVIDITPAHIELFKKIIVQGLKDIDSSQGAKNNLPDSYVSLAKCLLCSENSKQMITGTIGILLNIIENHQKIGDIIIKDENNFKLFESLLTDAVDQFFKSEIKELVPNLDKRMASVIANTVKEIFAPSELEVQLEQGSPKIGKLEADDVKKVRDIKFNAVFKFFEKLDDFEKAQESLLQILDTNKEVGELNLEIEKMKSISKMLKKKVEEHRLEGKDDKESTDLAIAYMQGELKKEIEKNEKDVKDRIRVINNKLDENKKDPSKHKKEKKDLEDEKYYLEGKKITDIELDISKLEKDKSAYVNYNEVKKAYEDKLGRAKAKNRYFRNQEFLKSCQEGVKSNFVEMTKVKQDKLAELKRQLDAKKPFDQITGVVSSVFHDENIFPKLKHSLIAIFANSFAESVVDQSKLGKQEVGVSPNLPEAKETLVKFATSLIGMELVSDKAINEMIDAYKGVLNSQFEAEDSKKYEAYFTAVNKLFGTIHSSFTPVLTNANNHKLFEDIIKFRNDILSNIIINKYEYTDEQEKQAVVSFIKEIASIVVKDIKKYDNFFAKLSEIMKADSLNGLTANLKDLVGIIGSKELAELLAKPVHKKTLQVMLGRVLKNSRLVDDLQLNSKDSRETIIQNLSEVIVELLPTVINPGSFSFDELTALAGNFPARQKPQGVPILAHMASNSDKESAPGDKAKHMFGVSYAINPKLVKDVFELINKQLPTLLGKLSDNNLREKSTKLIVAIPAVKDFCDSYAIQPEKLVPILLRLANNKDVFSRIEAIAVITAANIEIIQKPDVDVTEQERTQIRSSAAQVKENLKEIIIALQKDGTYKEMFDVLVPITLSVLLVQDADNKAKVEALIQDILPKDINDKAGFELLSEVIDCAHEVMAVSTIDDNKVALSQGFGLISKLLNNEKMKAKVITHKDAISVLLVNLSNNIGARVAVSALKLDPNEPVEKLKIKGISKLFSEVISKNLSTGDSIIEIFDKVIKLVNQDNAKPENTVKETTAEIKALLHIIARPENITILQDNAESVKDIIDAGLRKMLPDPDKRGIFAYAIATMLPNLLQEQNFNPAKLESLFTFIGINEIPANEKVVGHLIAYGADIDVEIDDAFIKNIVASISIVPDLLTGMTEDQKDALISTLPELPVVKELFTRFNVVEAKDQTATIQSLLLLAKDKQFFGNVMGVVDAFFTQFNADKDKKNPTDLEAKIKALKIPDGVNITPILLLVGNIVADQFAETIVLDEVKKDKEALKLDVNKDKIKEKSKAIRALFVDLYNANILSSDEIITVITRLAAVKDTDALPEALDAAMKKVLKKENQEFITKHTEEIGVLLQAIGILAEPLEGAALEAKKKKKPKKQIHETLLEKLQEKPEEPADKAQPRPALNLQELGKTVHAIKLYESEGLQRILAPILMEKVFLDYNPNITPNDFKFIYKLGTLPDFEGMNFAQYLLKGVSLTSDEVNELMHWEGNPHQLDISTDLGLKIAINLFTYLEVPANCAALKTHLVHINGEGADQMRKFVEAIAYQADMLKTLNFNPVNNLDDIITPKKAAFFREAIEAFQTNLNAFKADTTKPKDPNLPMFSQIGLGKKNTLKIVGKALLLPDLIYIVIKSLFAMLGYKLQVKSLSREAKIRGYEKPVCDAIKTAIVDGSNKGYKTIDIVSELRLKYNKLDKISSMKQIFQRADFEHLNILSPEVLKSLQPGQTLLIKDADLSNGMSINLESLPEGAFIKFENVDISKTPITGISDRVSFKNCKGYGTDVKGESKELQFKGVTPASLKETPVKNKWQEALYPKGKKRIDYNVDPKQR